MGQKAHPTGLRLKIVKEYESNWFANRNKYADSLIKDLSVREYLSDAASAAEVSKIFVAKTSKDAEIKITAARPAIIIGSKGQGIEKLRVNASKIMGMPVHITIEEVKKPELDAKLVARSIAQQLERRVMFRRAMKRAIANAMKAQAKGIKVSISGRLGGAEIARTEWAREGRVPLHTLRALIDYGFVEAKTTYGIIGVKVWIFKGEVLNRSQDKESVKVIDQI